MKILVTGGAGYLGSVLVPQLLDLGHEVCVIDSFRYNQNSLSACCVYPSFDVVKGDVRDKRVMGPLLSKADVIIPLAAIVGAPACAGDTNAAVTTNQMAVEWLTDEASSNQIILYPNTNSGYGIGEPGKFCDETTPLRPISLYGITKCQAEKVVLERGNSVVFRFATVFGMSPRHRIDLLVNDFVHRAINDKSVTLFEAHFKRNYVHVRDVASVFCYAIADSLAPGVYNVGLSDANLSKAELCTLIQKHIPDFVFTEAPIGEDVDKRDYIVSNSKIEAAGWKARLSVDFGIVELMKGYRMIRNSVYGNV